MEWRALMSDPLSNDSVSDPLSKELELELTSLVSSGYFEPLFTTWPLLKVLGLLLFLVAQTVGNALRLGVVWYVNWGCSDHLRTLINQLIAAFCTILVVANLTLANGVLVMHLVGHYTLPLVYCRTLVFSANFALANLLLFETTVTALRAMYIFKWKNVGKRDEDLTAIIVTCILVALGFGFALTLHWLDFDANCIHFYVCLNQRPPNELFRDTPAVISFWLLCGLLFTSLLLHTSVFVRIHVYNRRKLAKDSFNQVNMTDALVKQRRKINRDVCTSMIGITLSSLCALPFLLGLRAFRAEDVVVVGSLANVCLYVVHFGIHFVLTVPMTITYYVNNKGLRTAVAKRINKAFNIRIFEAVSRNESFIGLRPADIPADEERFVDTNEETLSMDQSRNYIGFKMSSSHFNDKTN